MLRAGSGGSKPAGCTCETHLRGLENQQSLWCVQWTVGASGPMTKGAMLIQVVENRATSRRGPLAALAVVMLALMSVPAVFVPSLLSEKCPLRCRVGSLSLDAHRVDDPSFEDLRIPAENEFLVY